MRKSFFKFCFIVALAWMVHATLPVATQAQQQPVAAPPSPAEDPLKVFLQNSLRKPRVDDDKTTRYFSVFVDLNSDRKNEAIVYLTGESWCGSGGCVALVLARKDSSYRVVTKISIARTPIRVLTAASNGWRNIGVWVQGGGIQPGYEAELRFDGKTYPSNPSTPPARRLAGSVPGKVVVPSSPDGKPLYP
jgi:hypothetical protein